MGKLNIPRTSIVGNMADDMMNKTIMSIMTAFVAVVLIASAFIPTVLPMIESEAVSKYSNILEIVVTMTVIGVVLGVIRMYMGKNRDE